MKKILILTLAASLIGITSCKKDNTQPVQKPTQNTTTLPTASADGKHKCAVITTCGTTQVVEFVAGRCNVGTVTVSNDQTNLTVVYTTTGTWNLRELHLYVGAQIPLRYGEPNLGQFPYTTTLSGTAHSYTFTIPLASLGSCFSIAAEATVNSCGNTQTAWAAGTRVSSRCSTATYFSYCKQSCGGNACILSAILIFSGEEPWPNAQTSVVVGGYTYTVLTIQPVLSEPSNDASAALFAVATLKVYGSSISPTAAVLSDATIAENWLATLGQLTATTVFTAPANVEASIANVQTWEIAHQCQ